MIKELFKSGWLFREMDSETFEPVTIPHTVHIEPLNVYRNKQGIFEYKREFHVDAVYPNQRVFLNFEAVMVNCCVYINGEKATEHFGGYLPFCIDITKRVYDDRNNEVIVVVDNRDDPNTPPGKPTEDLDFLYYGGIYRNVSLYITPEVYLTDPMDKSVADGGVKIGTQLHPNYADIEIKENIKNTGKEKKVFVTHEIFLHDTCVAKESESVRISAYRDVTVCKKIRIDNPELWNVDSPVLYHLVTTISFDNRQSDSRETFFGIRAIWVNQEGLWLNGQHIRLFGLNRGQQYPYIGIAASDRAQRREARMLKESGVNCLRLSHYPQSPAFIDECDRLGLLLIDPVPGWQFLGGEIWRKRLKENLIDLIRRDRNHPSVIIIEVTPNETNWSSKKGDLFFHHLNEIAKRESNGILTGGDSVGRKNSLYVGFDVPYYGKDGRSFVSRKLYPDNRLTLKREYGDWGFGGNESTSRVARGDGETAMQIQTWNFQFTHNDNLRQNGIIGDLIWEGIDHNRGYYPKSPISKSGIFDVFRVPKLSYQFVRSQKKALSDEDYVIYLNALKWETKNRLVFFSNCERLELYGDGKFISSSICDHGPDRPFNKRSGKKINDHDWMTNENHIVTSQKACPLAKHAISCMFDSGNCCHMDFPPFTFNGLDMTDISSLEVKGMAGGKCVIKKTFYRTEKATALKFELRIHDIPLMADDNDFIFVYVHAINPLGNIDTDYSGAVSLFAQNASIIGHSVINAEIGTAAFMVKSDLGVQEITLIAHGAHIGEVSQIVTTQQDII